MAGNGRQQLAVAGNGQQWLIAPFDNQQANLPLVPACVLALSLAGQLNLALLRTFPSLSPCGRPYYFNHLMAIQMSGGGANVVLGPRYQGSGHPDLDWLQAELAGPAPPKMVVITNPCNPTGVSRPAAWVLVHEVQGCILAPVPV